MSKSQKFPESFKPFARTAGKLVKNLLHRNNPLKDSQNQVYSSVAVLASLVRVAVTRNFTENGVKILKLMGETTPDGDTILYRLKKLSFKEAMRSFEKLVEHHWRIAKKQRLFNKAVCVAIDFFEIPYYGNKNDPMVVGTKEKLGTCYAYRFATLNIVEPGRRFTIKVIPVPPLARKERIVRDLVEFAQQKLKVKIVLLDRGFCSVKIVNILKKLGVGFIMPKPKTQKVRKLARNAPCVVDYEMMSGTGEVASVKLVLVKKGNEVFAWITNTRLGEGVVGVYSKRWGVETSYRVKNQFRARTTSKSYVVRLFYFLLAVSLYNAWVLCNVLVGIMLYGTAPEKPLIEARIFNHFLNLPT